MKKIIFALITISLFSNPNICFGESPQAQASSKTEQKNNLQQAKPYVELGLEYMDKKNWKLAERYFNKAIELDSVTHHTYYFRSIVYVKTKKLHRALSDLNFCIKSDPNNAIFYHDRGSVYFSLKKYSKAMMDFTLSEAIDPKYPGNYAMKGLIYYQLEKYESAIKQFNQAALLYKEQGEHDLYLQMIKSIKMVEVVNELN